MEKKYIHLPPGAAPPKLDYSGRFAALVIIELEVTHKWRDQISDWLVEQGCLYMMAWGTDCILWHDGVDDANMRAFIYKDIPDEHFVLTTWHDDEPLREVLWDAQHLPFHETTKLKHLLLLDISPAPRGDAILKQLDEASNLHLEE